MLSEKDQFRVLYRTFLFRIVDLDLLSTGGDIRNLLFQIIAMLAAFSLVISYVLLPRYLSSNLSEPNLLIATWGDEEFLIATTMVTIGLSSTFAWNSILPQPRDSLVLGLLPIKLRTMAAAKLAAATTTLVIVLIAVNLFTGIGFPLLMVPPNGNLFRYVAAYWLTMAAAALFVFFVFISLRSAAGLIVPYRILDQFSGYLQLCVVFTVLIVYFLTPPLATLNGLTVAENKPLISWLPSFWFLGLFQILNGAAQPIFYPLAFRSLLELLLAFVVAAVTFWPAFRRQFHSGVEQSHLGPADQVHSINQVAQALTRRVFRRCLDRAVFLFTIRTLARSNEHRLLLATNGGISFAIAVVYGKSFLAGYRKAPWYEPNLPFLIANVLLLTVAVVGVRALFAFPMSLSANWIFRVTTVHSPAAYFSAVRRSLFILTAVPIWAGAAVLFFAIWPARFAGEHLIVLGLLSCLLVDLSLYRFRKIPFTCSYLPGGANLKVRFGIYGALITTLASIVTSIEFWAMDNGARFMVLLAILCTALVWARARAREFANSPYNRLQFEDTLAAEIFALDLRPDGSCFGDEAFVNAIEEDLSRPFLKRMMPLGVLVLVLLTFGFLYEKIHEWKDARQFPQIGYSVNIGKRALNLYCSGEGTPTVILESNGGVPGYAWVFVQKKIANFTRTCWYDRAGLGWSEPGPFPNHSDSVARDLHKLLTTAKIPRPYVLVGHSMGAFHVRVYRGYYPSEVTGMVLVDPMNEDMTMHIHNHVEALRPTGLFIIQMLGRIGVFRLLAQPPDAVPVGLTLQEWAAVSALRLQPKSMVASGHEPPLWLNGELARASGDFGNIPVVVLSAGIQDQEEDPKLDHDHYLKLDLHAKLARLSTRGTHIVVNTSGHQIQWEAPEAVIAAVHQVVKASRQLKAGR